MINKQLFKNKVGGTKVIEVFMITIIGIFLFSSILIFINVNANEAGVAIDSRFNSTLRNLTANQDILSANVKEMRNTVSGITEAPDVANVAVNGLKGTLGLIKLPFQIFNTVINTFLVSSSLIDFLPTEIVVVVTLIISILIIFAITRLIFNRGNDA